MDHVAVLVLVSACLLPLGCGPASARPPESEPRALVFDAGRVALGRLQPGRERRVRIAWHRTGRGPLRILRARTDCGCALVQGVPPVLPEGARGAWMVSLSVRRQPGPLRYRLRVITDGAPGQDVSDVFLAGHVATDFDIRPIRLDLEEGIGGAEAVALVSVRWDPSTLQLALPGARLIGLAGHVQIAPPARAGATGVQLILTIQRPQALGRFSGWLEVDLGPRGPTTLPIQGEVIPASFPPGAAAPGARRAREDVAPMDR